LVELGVLSQPDHLYTVIRFLVISQLILVTTGFCVAQKQVDHQQQVWLGYNNTIKFDSTWSLLSEVQERRFVNPDAQSQFLIRTELHRNLGKGWDIGAGLSYFLQSPGNPESDVQLVVPEIRPDIQFNYRQKFKSWSIEHRYKFEARFLHNVNLSKEELEDGFTFATFRLRYRLGFIVPIFKFNNSQKLTLKAGDEILFNVGKKVVYNFFDQNRIFIGLNWTMSPSFALEMNYINWFQQQSSGVKYYNRDIFRLALYHSLKTKRTL